MQKCFLIIHKLRVTGWIVVLLTGLALTGLQAQNPFEIKSRSLIDTTHSVQDDTTPISIPPNTLDISDSPRSEINLRDSMEIIMPEEMTSPPVSKSDGSRPGDTSDMINVPSGSDSGFGLLSGKNNRNEVIWWHYIFDLVLLLLLLGVFLYDKKIFQPIRKAFVHENFLRFLYRDTYLRKPATFIYLNILFLLNLGFILYRTAQYLDRASTFRDYLIIQAVVIFLFALKHLALHLLCLLVDKPFEVRFYQYWMILSAGLIGLWMIPVTLMISVLPLHFLLIALIVSSIPIALLLIYRQAKAVLQAKFFLFKHFFHFFLYFCAVEIVPVVLLADILVQN